MSEKRLVVTAACTDAGRLYAKVTHPLIAEYAQKCHADFYAMLQWPKGYEGSGYAKWAYIEFLKQYDRILHIDTDMVVRSTTPNLFEIVSPGAFAAVNEYPFQDLRHENPAVDRYSDMRNLGVVEPMFYVNVGLYMFDKNHSFIFDQPLDPNPCYFKEQSHINYNLHRGKHIELLPPDFNYMKLMENAGLDKEEAYIIHYAGAYGGLSTESVIDLMKRDIK